MRESQLLTELIRKLYPTVHLYRTNAGTFRSLDGSHVIRGLPKGFSDLFGVIPRQLTESGEPLPVFLEAKIYPNRASAEQIAFLRDKHAEGCVAGVVYDVEDAWKLISPHLKR